MAKYKFNSLLITMIIVMSVLSIVGIVTQEILYPVFGLIIYLGFMYARTKVDLSYYKWYDLSLKTWVIPFTGAFVVVACHVINNCIQLWNNIGLHVSKIPGILGFSVLWFLIVSWRSERA